MQVTLRSGLPVIAEKLLTKSARAAWPVVRALAEALPWRAGATKVGPRAADPKGCSAAPRSSAGRARRTRCAPAA